MFYSPVNLEIDVFINKIFKKKIWIRCKNIVEGCFGVNIAQTKNILLDKPIIIVHSQTGLDRQITLVGNVGDM